MSYKPTFIWLKERDKILVGVGTFLFGIATCAALLNSQQLINEVLHIQSQAKEILTAITILRKEMKNRFASNQVDNSNILQSESSTFEEINNYLSNLAISNEGANGIVYLPESNVDQAAKAIKQATNPTERKIILEQYLEYRAPENTQ